MIRINLLPVKAAHRHDTAKNELLAMAGGIAVVLVILFFWNSSLEAQIQEAQQRIKTVAKEIEQLKQDVVRVEDFKKKAEVLSAKLKAIETLKAKKVGPAKMLDDLAKILTDEKKVWLTRLSESAGFLTLEGAAMEHENISDFQLAMEKRSKFFSDVTLAFVQSTKEGGIDYLTWKITCKTTYTAG